MIAMLLTKIRLINKSVLALYLRTYLDIVLHLMNKTLNSYIRLN